VSPTLSPNLFGTSNCGWNCLRGQPESIGTGPLGTIYTVSCIQYRPEAERTRNEAERLAILKVRRALRKREFDGFVAWDALVHRNSGHIHVCVGADENDSDLICFCCKEAQKPMPSRRGHLRYKTCNCGDCVACDPEIRIDLEQLTRE
jgi:hypothetical protein